MKCPYCGEEIKNESGYCEACGKTAPAVVELKEGKDYVGPLGTSRPILTWGILSLGFGCIPFTCVLGIIFGIIGLRRAAQHERFTGTLLGPARAGKILSWIGLVVGSVMTGLVVWYCVRWFSIGSPRFI